MRSAVVCYSNCGVNCLLSALVSQCNGHPATVSRPLLSLLSAAAGQVFSKFSRHFGGQQLCLQTNFRSTAAICAFGGALLHSNRRQAHKCMLPARAGACPPVSVRQFHTAQLEAAAMASEVLRLWREEAVPYRDMCLLYRCLRLQGTQPHAPLMAALRR